MTRALYYKNNLVVKCTNTFWKESAFKTNFFVLLTKARLLLMNAGFEHFKAFDTKEQFSLRPCKNAFDLRPFDLGGGGEGGEGFTKRLIYIDRVG